MTHFDIVPVDPSNHALVESWLATHQAVEAHDFQGLRPQHPLRRLTSLVVAGRDQRDEFWAAVCDGVVLGSLRLSLSDRDNTHLAMFSLSVHPDHRGRGVATALLRHAEERAAEDGRTTISSWLDEPSKASPLVRGDGGPFLVHKGYQRSLQGLVRRCDLDAVDEEALERLWREARERSADFEVIAYENTAPDDLVDGVAYMQARMYTDMPLGDWDLQEAVIDRGHVRETERLQRLKGDLRLHVVVRHKESGEIAGHTEILVEGGEEEHCTQGDTIVDPRFRGHRLGLVLKIANQRRVREWRPRMRYVWTGNAESNSHMIAINEAVGYRLAGRDAVYQKKLSQQKLG